MAENNDKYYRFCFECDKWLTKDEINKIDWGPQPGGGDGKTYNCKYCRKDLGDQIQIFHCPHHNDIILKVWGVIEGKNKEKVFYANCPNETQEAKPSKQPPSDKFIGFCITSLITVAGILILIYLKKKNNE